MPALNTDEGVEFVGKPAAFGIEVRERYTNERYHKPSDEVTPDWDLSGLAEDVQLLFAVGYRVAQADALSGVVGGQRVQGDPGRAAEREVSVLPPGAAASSCRSPTGVCLYQGPHCQRDPASPACAIRTDAPSMADSVANPDMLRALVREIEDLRAKVDRQLNTIDKALAVARELADRVGATETARLN